jgi:6,7-dimethyl-8-ribityllumazine synthase
MNMIQANLNKTYNGVRIGIVVSLFNSSITDRLYQGCLQSLLAHGVDKKDLTVVEVPGAFELPLVAKQLLSSNKFDAVIILGAVIRGETDHYDYVCQQVSAGCQQVSLEMKKPVIFGVLTTNNEDEALARVGGKHGHKGDDAAQAALMMVDIMNQF